MKGLAIWCLSFLSLLATTKAQRTVTIWNTFEDSNTTGGNETIFDFRGPFLVGPGPEFVSFPNGSFYNIDVGSGKLEMTLKSNTGATDLILPKGRFDRYYFMFDTEVTEAALNGTDELNANSILTLHPPGTTFEMVQFPSSNLPQIVLTNGGIEIELGPGTDLTELEQTVKATYSVVTPAPSPAPSPAPASPSNETEPANVTEPANMTEPGNETVVETPSPTPAVSSPPSKAPPESSTPAPVVSPTPAPIPLPLFSGNETQVTVWSTFQDSNITQGNETIFDSQGPVIVGVGPEFTRFPEGGFYDIDFVDGNIMMTLKDNSDASSLVFPEGRFDRYYFQFNSEVTSAALDGTDELNANAILTLHPPGTVVELEDLFAKDVPLPIILENGGIEVEFGPGTNLTILEQKMKATYSLASDVVVTPDPTPAPSPSPSIANATESPPPPTETPPPPTEAPPPPTEASPTEAPPPPTEAPPPPTAAPPPSDTTSAATSPRMSVGGVFLVGAIFSML